jgi:hypothetical protein
MGSSQITFGGKQIIKKFVKVFFFFFAAHTIVLKHERRHFKGVCRGGGGLDKNTRQGTMFCPLAPVGDEAISPGCIKQRSR